MAFPQKDSFNVLRYLQRNFIGDAVDNENRLGGGEGLQIELVRRNVQNQVVKDCRSCASRHPGTI